MYGTLQELQPDVEPIKAYLERGNVFFEANSIAAGKQVPVLLSAIGPKIYSLLRSLTSPALPHKKSFDELATILQSHFQPKPLLIAERLHFHCRDQAADESIAEYVAELRRLSTNCEFEIHSTMLSETDSFVECATQVHRNAYSPKLI